MGEQGIFELKKKLKMLSKKRGRHTELISVYIPDGYEISKVAQKLSDEQGTASNIKSATTRKNVTTALTKILQHMKLYKRTPKNGVAIFCGNVAEQEGTADFIIEAIIPPKPINISLYRCSQRFVLDPLLDMMEERETYGFIVIDRRRADIALLRGKSMDHVAKVESFVPGKFRAGGQSAQRFERVIEGMAKDFYRKVGEHANQIFREHSEVKGIVVGGPGPTKNDFLDEGLLANEVKEKVLGVLDIGYTGEDGLQEILQKSEEVLTEAEVTKERKIVQEFLGHLAKDTGLAAYGEQEVREALMKGAVETLLVSEGLEEKKRLRYVCDKCGEKYSKSMEEVADTEKCIRCGGTMRKIEEEDLIEDLTELAKEVGSKLELISVDTKEGQQLFNLGGIAAILRFKL